MGLVLITYIVSTTPICDHQQLPPLADNRGQTRNFTLKRPNPKTHPDLKHIQTSLLVRCVNRA